MRHLGKFIVALLLLLVTATANSAERLLKDFSGKNDVTTSYISSALLGSYNLNNTLSGLGIDDGTNIPMIGKLESVEVVKVEKSRKVKKYKSTCKKLITRLENEGRAELLTETSEGNETVLIYSLKDLASGQSNGILVYSLKSSEINLVVVHYTPTPANSYEE
jgi:hypothetical protein